MNPNLYASNEDLSKISCIELKTRLEQGIINIDYLKNIHPDMTIMLSFYLDMRILQKNNEPLMDLFFNLAFIDEVQDYISARKMLMDKEKNNLIIVKEDLTKVDIPNEDRPKTAYQQFIVDEIRKQRKKTPGLSNREYMSTAAKIWIKYKADNGIMSDASAKIRNMKLEKTTDMEPLDKTTSMESLDKTADTESRPKSAYQRLISAEIKKRYEKTTDMESLDKNTDIKTLDKTTDTESRPKPADEWNKYKEANGIVTGGTKTKKVTSFLDDIKSAKKEDVLETTNTQTLSSSTNLSCSSYQQFIQDEIMKQRTTRPGLSDEEYNNIACREYLKMKLKKKNH